MAARLRAGVEAGIADGSISRRRVHAADAGERRLRDAARRASPTGCASRFRFYDWDAAKNEVRWMCSFDTTEADIDAFVAGIREELARA